MRKILATLLTIMLLMCSQVSIARSVKSTITRYISIEQQNIKFSNTQKGMNNCINGSFFNVNTRKMVPVGLKNRPFIIKRGNEILFSDNMKDIFTTDEVISAGSWLIKDSKIYSSNDGFSNDFKNQITNRTIIAKKGNKILLIVITNSNYNYCKKYLLFMHVDSALMLDGGSSSTFRAKGKTKIQGKPTVNYIGD